MNLKLLVVMSTDKVQVPNIFSFAPSELTQDAFICWLANWANKHLESINRKLHQAGRAFVKSMLSKHEIYIDTEKISPIIKKQHHSIDVLIELSEYVLLIDAKVFTRQHSNQLQRYKEILEEEYQDKQILPIYFQTGSQSNYDSVIEKGYKPFLRKDFLDVLENGLSIGVNNDIFTDFYNHLKQIDSRFNSFQNKPVGNWDWDGWKGFYAVLKDEFNEGGWNYVANPSGGFMGFWWHFIDMNDCTIYLQLENDKLCFKISVKEREDNYSKLRNYWHRKIISSSERYDLNVRKPDRFGHGKQMTVAVLDSDYRATDENNMLDLDQTIQTLKKAIVILEESYS